MITVSLRKIVEAATPTSSGRTPIAALSSLGLPAAKAWDRMLKVEAVEAHVSRFSKARQEVFSAHEGKDDGGRILAVDENHPEFVEIDRALGELLDVEVSIDVEPITLSDLGTGQISADEMRGIRFLLK